MYFYKYTETRFVKSIIGDIIHVTHELCRIIFSRVCSGAKRSLVTEIKNVKRTKLNLPWIEVLAFLPEKGDK